jgi:hypothetical protein
MKVSYTVRECFAGKAPTAIKKLKNTYRISQMNYPIPYSALMDSVELVLSALKI